MVFPSQDELDGLILGPDSVAWRVTSDLRLNLAMLYPLLLQVAHPTVDAGVTDHSDFEHRPWDRLLRTMDYVSVLVYGGREAIAAGRRLRNLHRRFKGTTPEGTRYSALEPTAYAWVHATLIATYIHGTARFGTPLTTEDTERFYAEYRGLGRLIGVRERDLPPTWPQFETYFRLTARTKLEPTPSMQRVLKTINHVAPPPTPISGPLWPILRVPASHLTTLGGIGLIDPIVRRHLGLGWNALDEAQFRALSGFTKRLGPLMPASLKVTGPGHLRWRSAEIAGGPLGTAA
ncbi:MAG TPA: oxygenase MpaB family protein [Solirubrobacteraceae bacterium]|nr:oxygenase MpaB family protein [Solirubrobacteraceae bacterium]